MAARKARKAREVSIADSTLVILDRLRTLELLVLALRNDLIVSRAAAHKTDKRRTRGAT